MNSIYDTIAIPLLACLLVCVGIVFWYPKYWKHHKIPIFSTMGIATFVWTTYMHNLLSIMFISVFAIVMVMAISICDALLTSKIKKKNGERAEAYKEEAKKA